ncbi:MULTISPECIES: S8 family serine peptidase [Deinococcus]|uniref:S8 family serine peptidase n=1 Tax=Deinococcus rufus TaxID=2136097 RepID=A0ABV7Z5D0_9DEIO|nr:S8 family serine peptidase [Deinococcus sp. AB2017081]WQE95422.1 S8 family serine peptidase [Deinococcus sp. AB2017081]
MTHRISILTALTLLLAACGSVPTPQEHVVSTTRVPTVTAQHALITLTIQPQTTRDQLQAALPGAVILSFHPEVGSAIVAQVPSGGSLTTAGLRVQALTALGATVDAVEANDQITAEGSEPSSLGLTTWAGGALTWAGGQTTWAGGVSGLDPVAQSTYRKFLSRIGMSESYIATMPTQGAGIKVAVIDTGVDMNHPFLKTQISTTQGWDFVDNDALPQEVASTIGIGRYGHGTAVTGVLLQVAPRVTVLPYRVLGPDGSGTVGNLVLAIDRAVADGAKVINLSLGLTSDVTALSTTLSTALKAGVVITASAGNANSTTLTYPARYATSGGLLSAPKFVGLVSVGSIDLDGSKSAFSNYSSDLKMSAPGNAIVSAYPGARLAYASGTSFAAPSVAGALALGMYRGTLTPGSLTDTLNAAGDTYTTLNVFTMGSMGRLLNVSRYLGLR